MPKSSLFALFIASHVISPLYLILTEKQKTTFTGRIHSFFNLFQVLSRWKTQNGEGEPHKLLSLIPPTTFYSEWTAGVGGRGKGEKTLARRGCWKAKHPLNSCTEMSRSPIKMSKIYNRRHCLLSLLQERNVRMMLKWHIWLVISLTAPIGNSFRGRTEISKITTTSGGRNLHSPTSLFLTVDGPLATNFFLSPAFRSH